MVGELRARQPMRTSYERARDSKSGFVTWGSLIWGKEEDRAYRVPVYVFSDGMNYYIRAVVEGILDIRGEKGIIDNDHDPMLMRDCSHITDIDET